MKAVDFFNAGPEPQPAEIKERVSFAGAPHTMQAGDVQKLLEQFGGGPVRKILGFLIRAVWPPSI